MIPARINDGSHPIEDDPRARSPQFADRYHQRIVTNPSQRRHALAYVLNNQRRHAAKERATYPRNRVDP